MCLCVPRLVYREKKLMVCTLFEGSFTVLIFMDLCWRKNAQYPHPTCRGLWSKIQLSFYKFPGSTLIGRKLSILFTTFYYVFSLLWAPSPCNILHHSDYIIQVTSFRLHHCQLYYCYGLGLELGLATVHIDNDVI